MREELVKGQKDIKNDFQTKLTDLEAKFDTILIELENRCENNLKDEIFKIKLDIESKEFAITKVINDRCKEIADNHNVLPKRIVQNEDHGRRFNIIVGV